MRRCPLNHKPSQNHAEVASDLTKCVISTERQFVLSNVKRGLV